MVIVLVIYVLINREEIRNRLLRLIGEGHMTLTTKALDDAAQGLSAYLLAQFMINASFGVVVGLGVWLVGLPYPLLWAVCSTFLRYIPFVGPWIALMFPLALSLAITPGWTKPLVIVAIFVGFELAANLAIEPLIYGQQMGVAPAPLLVAIAFWSWLWGAMGLVLAVPLTVCLVVLGKHVPALKFFDILLGDEPALTADVHFYQRLLARDEDEALEILRVRLQEIPLEQVFDEIVIPALITARTDFEAEALSEGEVASIFEMIRELVEEIGSAQAELQARPATGPEAAAAPAPAKLMILGLRGPRRVRRDGSRNAPSDPRPGYLPDGNRLDRSARVGSCRARGRGAAVARLHRLPPAGRTGAHAALVQAASQPLWRFEDRRRPVGAPEQYRTKSRSAHDGGGRSLRHHAARFVHADRPARTVPELTKGIDRRHTCVRGRRGPERTTDVLDAGRVDARESGTISEQFRWCPHASLRTVIA